MPCIIKFPGKTKGFVSFTKEESSNIGSFDSLRDKWVIGLHHNWQPSTHDGRFDVNLIGKQFMSTSGAPVIDMGASNFIPSDYCRTPYNNKHWDILYTPRTVNFKRISAFLNVIRALYDNGYYYRVLLVACNPPTGTPGREPENLLEDYKKMFSHDERKRFNLLEMNYNYPFTFDKETLSLFFKSSKIFVHMAQVENWSRISAQAHACGMPLVSYPCQATRLPTNLRKPPVNYVGNNDSEIVSNIVSALSDYEKYYDSDEIVSASEFFNYEKTKERFKSMIKDFFQSINLECDYSDGFNMNNLDRRIARHTGKSIGDNKVPMDIEKFIGILKSDVEFNSSDEDLEMSISRGNYE